jgi:hypothetical protein
VLRPEALLHCLNGQASAAPRNRLAAQIPISQPPDEYSEAILSPLCALPGLMTLLNLRGEFHERVSLRIGPTEPLHQQ